MIKFTVDNFDEYNINKSVILKLIQQHSTLAQRIEMLEAYYDGEHAIKQRTRTKGAPNNKIAVNFAKYITDISTGYFISNPITYSCADTDLEALLTAFDHAYVDDTDADNAFEASQNGLAFEYVYAKEGETELRTKNLCAKNTFMIYDTSIEENEVAAVYYRTLHDDATDRLKYVATVCTTHFIYELNIYDSTEVQLTTEQAREHYFGAVPVICYQNNHNAYGDYEQVIDLIDAYNTVMSDRVNDIQDFVDAVLVIYGTLLSDEGDEAGEAKKALHDGKLLEFPDKQTMGAEWLTRQLDESGVEVLQTAIAKDILRMAYVPDFTDENFANNASGVAIAFKCLLLEWMTKTKERYYRQGLRKRIRLFCTYLGLKQILIDADSVVPHFVRALPTNQVEVAQIVSMLDGKVSQMTLLQQIPFVEYPAAEIEALEAEKDKAVERQQAIFGMRPNTPPDDEEDDEDEVDNEDDI